MKFNKQELRKAAEKATEGNYVVGHCDINKHGNLSSVYICQEWNGMAGGVVAECHVNCLTKNSDQVYANAGFMALASPANVISLLEEISTLESRCAELAAENAGLKSAIETHKHGFVRCNCCGDELMCHTDDVCRALDETPATDAFLAEVRAQARNEGINYAASRLAAAFNHGFVDKPLAEVLDVVHMIMDTKEELANSTLPAADGLSGEYAEKFLTEFAGYARKGEEPEEGQSFLSDEDCQAFVKAFTKGDAK
ncbi:ead/Ea22-like family protein [Enterobacter asburiae]|nr:ead/Ea22-like family protein [Enterobacter asburiae]